MNDRHFQWQTLMLFVLYFLLTFVAVVFGLILQKGSLAPPIDNFDFGWIAWRPVAKYRATGAFPAEYPYPLWTPLLMWPFTMGSHQQGAIQWLLASLAALAGASLALTRLWRWPVYLAPLIGFVMILQDRVQIGIWVGQVLVISLLCVILVQDAVARRRYGLAGFLLGATLIKPHMTILAAAGLLAWALWTRRWQLLLGYAGVAVALVSLAAPFAASPRQVLGGGIPGHAVGGLYNGATLWGLILRTVPGQWWWPALAVAIGLGWLAVSWLRAIHADTVEHSLPYLLAISQIVILLAIPYSWSYNCTLLVVPLTYVLDRTWRAGRRTRLIALIGVMFVAGPLSQALAAYWVEPTQLDVYFAVLPLACLPLVLLARRVEVSDRVLGPIEVRDVAPVATL